MTKVAAGSENARDKMTGERCAFSLPAASFVIHITLLLKHS